MHLSHSVKVSFLNRNLQFQPVLIRHYYCLGKGACKRFYTKESRNFLKQMQLLEETRKIVMSDFARRIFEKFSRELILWKKMVHLVAELDVLASLAEYARNQEVICVPEIVDDEIILMLDESYHPSLNTNGDFIPNGIQLGGHDKAPLALLTGPNMGGYVNINSITSYSFSSELSGSPEIFRIFVGPQIMNN